MIRVNAAVLHYPGDDSTDPVSLAAGDGVWVRITDNGGSYALAVVLAINVNPESIAESTVDVCWLYSLAAQSNDVETEIKTLCVAIPGFQEDDVLLSVSGLGRFATLDLKTLATGRFQVAFAGESMAGKKPSDELPVVVIRGFLGHTRDVGVMVQQYLPLDCAAVRGGAKTAFDLLAAWPQFMAFNSASTVAELRLKGVPLAYLRPLIDMRGEEAGAADLIGVAKSSPAVPARGAPVTSHADAGGQEQSRKRPPASDEELTESVNSDSPPMKRASDTEGRWGERVRALLQTKKGPRTMMDARAVVCGRSVYHDAGGWNAGKWAVSAGVSYVEVESYYAHVVLRHAFARALNPPRAKTPRHQRVAKVTMPPPLVAELLGDDCEFESFKAGRTAAARSRMFAPATRGEMVRARVDMVGLGVMLNLTDDEIKAMAQGVILTTDVVNDYEYKQHVQLLRLRKDASHVAAITYDLFTSELSLRFKVVQGVHTPSEPGLDLTPLLVAV